MPRIMLKEETQQTMAERMMQLPVSKAALNGVIDELADRPRQM